MWAVTYDMKYDNERDQNSYGYDAGHIIDGEVKYDPDLKEYVITDEDGVSFSSQELFKKLLGKKIRFTCISFESIAEIEKMLVKTGEVEN